MSPTLTPEQAEALRALDEGELQIKHRNDSLWTKTIPGNLRLLKADDYEFRIKPKPEIVRRRIGVARREDGSVFTATVRSEADAADWLQVIRKSDGNKFVGWAGPWQEIDVSTLTKDEA